MISNDFIGADDVNETVYETSYNIAALEMLIHCGLVMSYGDRDLGQHRLR